MYTATIDRSMKNMKSLTTALIILCFPMFAMAAMRTPTIEYKIDGQTFKGYAAYDDADARPHPGVLLVPEWWGLNGYVKMRADQLAKEGYVAFVADMYGDGKVTTDPREAGAWAGPILKDRAMMRKRVAAGLEQLKKLPGVSPDQLAAIGFCFGGTSVLELARDGQEIRAVVGFHAGLSNPSPADPDRRF